MANTSKSVACERIAVTGFGLVTPMACTVWRSVAALFHNRCCFAGHPTVLVADDAHGAVLRGATVSRVAHGINRQGLKAPELACALMAPALRECLSSVPKSDRTSIELRLVNGIAGDDGTFASLLEDEMQNLLPQRSFLNYAAGVPGRHEYLEQIILAVGALRKKQSRSIVVAGVDSLCFLPVLQQLMEDDKLQSGANPEGIIPGEAAGAILLEPEEDARRRGAPIYAVIASWGRGNDPAPRADGKYSAAQGLTAAFSETLGTLPDCTAKASLVIGDLNGDRQRAIEWALVEGRIFAAGDMSRQLWLPGFTAGDCGSAMGALQSVAAVAALGKGLTDGGYVAAFSSDNNGESRVLCFGPGDFNNRHAINQWRREQHSRPSKGER